METPRSPAHLDERIDMLSTQKIGGQGPLIVPSVASLPPLRISVDPSAILFQARELESESRWFLWRREPFAPCGRPFEREIDGSSANGFRAMTNAAIDGEHLPGQELHRLFIKFNKWGSCLSTVTTTACGFVFGRESAKADSEWVA
jgi:hypothetical protein